MVREETVILRREKRAFDELRDLLVGDRNTPLLADLRDQRAAARIHAQWHLQLQGTHRLGGG